jgi:DNA-binding CsgD family transcriptional regulator
MNAEPDTGLALYARWIDAYNARDIDALCAVAHPHIEVVPTRVFAPPGTSYHGHDGIRSLAAYSFENHPTAHGELQGVEGHDDWRVVRTRMSCRGSDARAIDVALLFRCKDGLIRRVHGFPDVAEAHAALEQPSDNEFRSLFDEDPSPIVLLEDTSLLADVNPAACKLLGDERAHLLGRPLADFLTHEGAEDWGRVWDALRLAGRASGRLTLAGGDEEPRQLAFWASAHYSPGRELALLRMSRAGATTGQTALLTRREQEIFQMLANGMNAPQIAENLFLSPLTVRTHVQNGMNRLGANTRVQAIALAMARGEIEL